jgi:hypothetical protein
MGVIVAHDIANDLGTFARFDISVQVLLPHCIENSSLYGLEAITHVGQCARSYDAESIVKVTRLRCLVESNVLWLISLMEKIE